MVLIVLCYRERLQRGRTLYNLVCFAAFQILLYFAQYVQ